MRSLLEKINNKLNAQGGFFKSVSILVGGTAFAQGIGVLALPLITRLYTPADFSVLAVYMSIIGIVAVASNLRFEIAIPIPRNTIDALSVLALALFSNILITFITALVIFFFKDGLIALTDQSKLEPYLWLIPIGIFFSGLYNAFQFWTTRHKKFGLISKTRISQSVGGISTQLLLGILGFSTLGLLLGHIVNLSAGIFALIKDFLRGEVRRLYRDLTFKRIFENLKEYQNFPKYSTFEALANQSGSQIPIIIIAAVAIGPEAGYLLLATRVMAIPIKFIGGAVSQVFLAHAPDEYNKGNIRSYTLECIRKILKIAGLPLIVICLISPIIFPHVFGVEWERAGEMVVWMLPWFLMQLITSPISMSLHIMKLQKVALILQFFGLIIRVGGLLLVAKYFADFAFEYYALSGFVFYLIYFSIIIYKLRSSDLNTLSTKNF